VFARAIDLKFSEVFYICSLPKTDGYWPRYDSKRRARSQSAPTIDLIFYFLFRVDKSAKVCIYIEFEANCELNDQLNDIKMIRALGVSAKTLRAFSDCKMFRAFGVSVKLFRGFGPNVSDSGCPYRGRFVHCT
jgi:hypothetical protein